MYSYSFALQPEDYQPTGCVNYSQIDNSLLIWDDLALANSDDNSVALIETIYEEFFIEKRNIMTDEFPLDFRYEYVNSLLQSVERWELSRNEYQPTSLEEICLDNLIKQKIDVNILSTHFLGKLLDYLYNAYTYKKRETLYKEFLDEKRNIMVHTTPLYVRCKYMEYLYGLIDDKKLARIVRYIWCKKLETLCLEKIVKDRMNINKMSIHFQKILLDWIYKNYEEYEEKIFIYARNYNLLRVFSGMGGLAYMG